MKYNYLVFFILLLIIGIPWYWTDNSLSIFWGFPIWVIVAIMTSFAASCLTAYIILKPINKKYNE